MNATERILRHASQLGFDDCAVARCHPLNSQRETFEEWLERGYDGSLSYLRRHVAKRFDPSLLSKARGRSSSARSATIVRSPKATYRLA